MSGLEERPDLLDLPMFGSDPDRGARRPGRVRGGFRFPEEPAEPPVAEKPRVVPIRPQQATPALPVAGVDWAEVTRFRSDVAKLLPARVGGVSDRSAEEAAGWSVIRQLLDEEAASSIAKTGDMRSVADQEAARCWSPSSSWSAGSPGPSSPPASPSTSSAASDTSPFRSCADSPCRNCWPAA